MILLDSGKQRVGEVCCRDLHKILLPIKAYFGYFVFGITYHYLRTSTSEGSGIRRTLIAYRSSLRSSLLLASDDELYDSFEI